MTASLPTVVPSQRTQSLPELEAGDHLDQPTFHARYLAMPRRFRAELIGGKVHVPSPLRVPHGNFHGIVMMWLNNYRARTPGTCALDNATSILANDSEPQPDASLFMERSGKTSINDEGYLVGPPELCVEVASCSESHDLYEKRDDYERYGVGEYLVLVVRDARAVWFTRPPQGEKRGTFIEMPAPTDRIFRSPGFPGLWLDVAALLRGDLIRLGEVLNQGLASPEHAAFAARILPPR